MTEIISVRFSSRGRAYYFDPSGLSVSKGDFVVVETAKGLEFGECVQANRSISDDAIIKPLRPVVRVATDTDKLGVIASKEKETVAFEYCQRKITEFELDMKLVDVEFGFEGNKILFFFTSEGRVDFRKLVKDLAGEFHSRIELRQIGVRDEAKLLGGLGVCGKQFCCSQFLTEFHPVSIKMAKVQGLSLNPTKISGTCGRLMCCLKYEENAYEDLTHKAPKLDSFVETPSGKGTVLNINLLRGSAKVRLESSLDTTIKAFSFDDLKILGGKARRAEYIAAKAEGRLEEAGFSADPPLMKPILPSARMSSASAGAPHVTNSAPSSVTQQHQTQQPANQQPGKPPAALDLSKPVDIRKKPSYLTQERQQKQYEPQVKPLRTKSIDDTSMRGGRKQPLKHSKGGYSKYKTK